MTNELKAAIDELGDLEQEIFYKKSRYEELRKKIGKIANENKEDLPLLLAGNKWEVMYCAPTKTLKCDLSPEKLIEYTGAWECLTVSTTVAKKAFPEVLLRKYFSTIAGSRRFKRVMPIRKVVEDYGSDPIGDGTYRMVPSGDIVTKEERDLRRKPVDMEDRIETLIGAKTKAQINEMQGGRLV